MKKLYSHILIPLLVLAITATTITFSASQPAHAVLGVGDVTATIETVSIPQIFFNSIVKAAEGAAYTVLKKAMRQGLANLTKSTLNNLLQGGKGKGELFETEPWDQFWQQAGDEASGAALEGFVQGFQNEYEAESKKSAALKNLEDKEASNLGPQMNAAGDANFAAGKCKNDHPSYATDHSCDALITAATTATDTYTKSAGNSFIVKKRTLLADRASMEKAESDARTAYNQCLDSHNNDQSLCGTEKTALTAQDAALDQNQKDLNDAVASADKATADELKKIDKEANKKDADLIAGNQGALTDAGRSLIDIVCKPTPDIALSIFLPLGDRIELNQRKPICPYKKIKENWSEIYNNTGARLDELSLTNWRTIAGLVNPNTSDLAAAYSVSIAGQSVSDVAKQLGITQYMDTATAGGLKAVTEFNGKKTSPVSGSVARLSSTITAGVQEDTRLISTGHLLADLVVTGLGTIINTSFDILQDGLKKKIAAVRQPKQNKGIAALSAFSGGGAAGQVLYNPSADPNVGSETYAEARLAVFSQLTLDSAEDWPVLASLNTKTCPDAQNIPGGMKGADPDACVMDDQFVQAVKERITVQEALDRNGGLLNKDGIFGFDISNASDTAHVKDIYAWERNFPYRSLVILRKYRVIPVSWEMAALYIKEHPVEARTACNGNANGGNSNCTLQNLIDQFPIKSSPFYQLVDPNWVLKIPPTKCFLKGYGPEVQEFTKITVCDPFGSTNCHDEQKPLRRPETCVDYQTCLFEDPLQEGKCANDQSYGYCLQEQKIIRFKGEKCDKEFNGCEIFQDSQTKQAVAYLKSSLEQHADLLTGKCSADNAGCRWFSAAKQFEPGTGANAGKLVLNADKQAKTKVVENGATAPKVKIQQEWSSAPDDRVYLATSSPKLDKCQPDAEGCREVSGVPGMLYLRLPPASYQCDKDGVDPYGNTIPWYKRAECKQFTGLCKQEYVGCEQYTPAKDTFSLTGISPDDSADPTHPYQYRCPSQCADIKEFKEKKTLFDTGDQTAPSGTFNFSADSARKCSIADVGCEEFTNVNVAASGGEGKEYYTYLQQCQQKKPEDVPADQVFLSFEGSDTAGGQPVKQYVVGTTVAKGAGDGAWDDSKAADWNPKCADSSKPCDCKEADVTKNMNDPRIGTILCREFINSKGKSFYRYTDNLIYYTTDCTPYRRTLDGVGATNQLYSQSLSKQCTSPAAVNCREYHAPTAGNVRVVFYDNFEQEPSRSWKPFRSHTQQADPALSELVRSNVGEVLGDHSLLLKRVGTTAPGVNDIKSVTFMLDEDIPFNTGKTYQISFVIKGVEGGGYVHAGATKQDGTDSKSIFTSGFRYSTAWERVQGKIDANTLTKDHKRLMFDISSTGSDLPTVLIDDIIVKEIEGIEYVIKDTWAKDGMCFHPKAGTAPQPPDFDNPAYLGCSLYTDRQGGQHAIQKFEKVCPLEMAGCMETQVTAGDRSYAYQLQPGVLTSRRPSYNQCDCDKDPNTHDCPENNSEGYAFASYQDNANGRCLDIYKESGVTKYRYYVNVKAVNQKATKQMYIIPDPSKQCSAQDNKCTAYGSPKLLTKTDGTEQLQTTQNTAQDATKDEWTEKEKWNIAYYKVTPEEAIAAQMQFAGGDTSGYNSGICRTATYTGTAPTLPILPKATDKGDLGCREYLTGSNGGKNYFRDPGNSVCQSPKEGQNQGYYYTCNGHDDIVCRTDGDCPVSNDQPGTCNIQKEIKTNCPLLPLTSSTVNPSEFVQICPASQNGCRKIIDPECKADTSTLRTDYGRSNAENGIPCTREYYFTDNLDKKSPECAQVDVEKGCLLFNDEGKKEYKYKLVTSQHCGTVKPDGTVEQASPDIPCTHNSDCTTGGQTCSFLKTDESSGDVSLAQNDREIFSTTQPTLCTCDASATREDDCPNSGIASELDPPVCYNRYTQNAANVGPRYRKYTKVRVDRTYDSFAFYAAGPSNLNISAGCPEGVSCDANTLIKVKQDRTCKTWLACSSYEKIGDKTICTKRTACDKGSAAQCDDGHLMSDVTMHHQLARMLSAHEGNILNSLSGIARPDYRFPGMATPSHGGYDSAFDGWTQNTIQGTESLFYTKLTSPVSPAFSTVNSCRLYPRQDAPITDRRLVDSCVADEGSAGIYGFCLEPYPAFKSDFEVSGRDDKRTCTNDPGAVCTNNSSCLKNGVQGLCVYRYYNNYCLNWFPVDRVNGQRNIVEANDQTHYSWFPGTPVPQSAYYCLRQQSTTESKNIGSYCSTGSPNADGTCPLPPLSTGFVQSTRPNGIEDLEMCRLEGHGRFKIHQVGANWSLCSSSSFDFSGWQNNRSDMLFVGARLLKPDAADENGASCGGPFERRCQPYYHDNVGYTDANTAEEDIDYWHIKHITYALDVYSEPNILFSSDPTGDKEFDYQSGHNGEVGYGRGHYYYWGYTDDPFVKTGQDPFTMDCPGSVGALSDRSVPSKSHIAMAGDPKAIFSHLAVGKVDLVGVHQQRLFFAIEPIDRLNKLGGWKWRWCNEGGGWGGVGTVRIEGMDLQWQNPAPSPVTVSRSSTTTYCSDIAKVVNSGQAVSRGVVASISGNMTTKNANSQVRLPFNESKLAGGTQPEVKIEEKWDSCTTDYSDPDNPPKIDEKNRICTDDKTDFNSRRVSHGDWTILSGTTAIDGAQLAKIRQQTQFEKVYGYWTLNGNVYGPGDQALVNEFWNDSKSGNVQHGSDPSHTYKSSDYYPRIVSPYSEDPTKSGKDDRFSVNIVGKNQVFISFYTHEPKDDHLPIRFLQIDWDDNGSVNEPINNSQDGIGNRTKEPPTTTAPDGTVTVAQEDTFNGYSFGHTYVPELHPDGVSGRKICVTIRDNFDAERKTCGEFGRRADGKIEVVRWTPPHI